MPKDTTQLRQMMDTQWESAQADIEDRKEAFDLGWLYALRWMAGGQQQILEDLSEDLGYNIEEQDSH